VDEEAAIRTVLARYVETWNAHDMTAWARLFTDDVDYVNRGGGWWKSNLENAKGHRSIHDMLTEQKQAMTYKAVVAKIAFLSPTIALVHATWEWPGFARPARDKAKDFTGVMTIIMVKQRGAWLIRALQNTVTVTSG
jgi:uncharacterized protein (TIGR02246 family)